MTEEQLYTLEAAQLMFAKSIFNGIWGLLEKENRSPEDDLEMLLAGYTSLYHWKKVGTPVHEQRGSWIISRIHLALGRAADALEWAQRCQDLAEEFPGEMKDFDLAYAQEGLARSYALAGDIEQAQTHWNQAAALGDQIADLEDKKIFLADFQGGDWYQLSND